MTSRSRVLDRIREGCRLLTGFGRRGPMERRLDEEMRFHVDMHTERNLRLGMEPDQARRAALVAFGGRQRFVEEARDEYRSRPVAELGQDLRHAARALRRAPGFAATAILTLALGIGATTVIFSVVDHIVLRPLGYPDPGRLVVIRETIREMSNAYPSLPANAGHFLEWRRRCGRCGDLALIRQADLTLTGDGDPERLAAVRATVSLFSVLGARVALGRSFTAEEDQQGRDRVVLISDGLWRRRFGADPSVVGSTMTLDGVPFVVVGVLAPSFTLPKGSGLGELFTLPARVDVYKPLGLTSREQTTPGEFDYAALARLPPGISVAAAAAELNRIQAGIAAGSSDRMTLTASLVPLEDQVVGAAGRPLLLLLAAVAAVLLIVCVNLASLMVARNASRRRESAVRLALGAARDRLVRYALSESLVLALAGGVLGIALAYWGLDALLALAPASLPRLEEVRLDMRVLAVALVVSVAAGIGFGTVPAIRLGRTDPAEPLRSGGRSVTEDRRTRRTRRLFIATQIGLTTVLLTGTGLLLMSFVRVLRVDKGFVPDRVLALDLVPPLLKYPSGAARSQVYQRAVERLASLPGVERIAFASWLPLEGETQVDVLSLEHDPRPELERPLVNLRYVSPGYFETLGTPIVGGRAFSEADRGRPVVVLSEAAARLLPSAAAPVGKRVVPGSNDPLAEVIGLASDAPARSLERPGSPMVYLPYWLQGPPTGSILIRTASAPTAMAALVRAALKELDPTMPVTRIRTLTAVVSASLAQRRFQLTLLVLFGVTALVTASIGVYGVIASSLARRTAEIGVRMAFGARRGDVHRLVLREGLTPVAIGLASGIAVTLALGRAFRALLFEVRPADPLTLVLVVLIVGAVGALACYVPAHRATSLDPATVLRVD